MSDFNMEKDKLQTQIFRSGLIMRIPGLKTLPKFKEDGKDKFFDALEKVVNDSNFMELDVLHTLNPEVSYHCIDLVLSVTAQRYHFTKGITGIENKWLEHIRLARLATKFERKEDDSWTDEKPHERHIHLYAVIEEKD